MKYSNKQEFEKANMKEYPRLAMCIQEDGFYETELKAWAEKY